MSLITIKFDQPINVSCKVGDYAYEVNTQSSGEFEVNDGNPTWLGTIVMITNATNPGPYAADDSDKPTIVCNDNDTLTGWTGSNSRFIFFTKNKSAEQSSLSGYYAKVRMQVEGGGHHEAPELFAVNMDMFESSK